LDVACGACYGSSILKRRVGVEMVVSVDIDRDAIKYGRMIYGTECMCADAAHLPFRIERTHSTLWSLLRL
jgi:hypothetical protein